MVTWRMSLRRMQVRCLANSKLTSKIVRNGHRKIASAQEGLLSQPADHQVGRLPFPRPGSNKETGSERGSRVPVPTDRNCHPGAAWKKQNVSEEGLPVPASRQLHPAAPNARRRCQSSAPCETRSCLSPPSPRRTGRTWRAEEFSEPAAVRLCSYTAQSGTGSARSILAWLASLA